MSADWTWTDPHYPNLTPALSDDHYRLHMAALEYALDPPILINRAADIQSTKHWSEKLKPFEHQIRNLITFCRRAPVALIADDVGLGKTVSAGLVLSELMTRGKVKRALVLAPSIILPQWKEELLGKFGIDSEHATGAELDGLLRGNVNVVITTYESARGRMKALCGAGFEMIIMDEAHKLRNLYGGQEPPKLATVIRDALKARAFRYVLLLTATPIHNRLWDLYSLIDLLTTAKGHANPLGSPEDFVSRFIEDRQTARKLFKGRRDEFRGILAQYMMRARRTDCRLAFPERTVKMFKGEATEGEKRLAEIVGKAIAKLNRFAQISVGQALFSSPQALRAQLVNMTRKETVPAGLLAQVDSAMAQIERTGKEALLLSFLEKLSLENPEEWRAIIFTGRIETQEAIGRLLSDKFGKLVGYIRGGDPVGNKRTIDGIWASPPRIRIVISTDAGSQGVNFQIANVLVNFDLPWNPMIVEQRIGRVQRLAAKYQHVVIANFVTRDSVEERIVSRLLEKLQLISEAIGDIEGVLEALPGSEEGAESFEEMIRKLVVDSLIGKDTTKAELLAKESIERAQEIYEEEKRVVDENLGSLEGMHNAGPSMPKLSPLTPSMSPQDFVIKALKADGARVEPREGGGYEARVPGRAPEIIFFREEDLASIPPGVFTGVRARVYQPGRQAFEQLVGRWSGLHEAIDYRSRAAEQSSVESTIQTWVSELPGVAMWACVVTSRRSEFEGDLIVHASAAVAHDKYEKLIRVPLGGVSQGKAFQLSPGVLVPLSDSLPPDPSLAEPEGPIRSEVGSDQDIRMFCDFYLARRTEEVQKTKGDPRLTKDASLRFTPSLSARVVGRTGVLLSRVVVNVELIVDDQARHECRLEVLPATQQILSEPMRRRCALTNRLLPVEMLALCAVSGKEVVAHQLLVSQESGRRALPEYFVKCGKSGAQVLRDETLCSDVSGVVALKKFFAESAVSNRPALLEEMTRCEVTQVPVFQSELALSEVSGRMFRADEKRVGGLREMTGHISEFVQCNVTQTWVLPREIGQSSVSRRKVRTDLLAASEKDPTRLGLDDEFVVCAVSGKRLLSDEVERSVVSQTVADRDLMQRSQLSRAWALPAELKTCEATGLLLLPSEVGTCSVTGRVVDKRQLVPSELSGALTTRDHLVPCAATGKRVLASELVQCEISGFVPYRPKLASAP